jgi:hypothetical protein
LFLEGGLVECTRTVRSSPDCRLPPRRRQTGRQDVGWDSISAAIAYRRSETRGFSNVSRPSDPSIALGRQRAKAALAVAFRRPGSDQQFRPTVERSHGFLVIEVTGRHSPSPRARPANSRG